MSVQDIACPYCGFRQNWRIQFKYGDCWQHKYQVEDELAWGGNDSGENVGGRVKIEGIAEETCLNCRADNIEAAVIAEENKLKKAILLLYPLNLEKGFKVLQ